MEGNRTRSLRGSFIIGPGYTMEELAKTLNEAIENFEAQSGTGEEGPSVIAARARIVNISSAPQPNQIPFTSSEENVQWSKDVKADRKEVKRRPTLTLSAVQTLETKLDSLNITLTSQLNTLPSTIAKAIKEINTTSPSSPLGVNWTPIIQGLVQVLGTAFGANVSFPSSAQPTAVEVQPVSTAPTQPSINVSSLKQELLSTLRSELASTLEEELSLIETKVDTLTSSVTQLTAQIAQVSRAQETATAQITQTNNTVSKLAELLLTLEANKNTKKGSKGSNGSSNGTTPSTPPTSSKTKLDVKLMVPSKPYEDDPMIESNIVTADLEALIEPSGNNYVFMAAWYSLKSNNIFTIDPSTLDREEFLREFWIDLLRQNRGKTCYFHNFGGYDSILSLPSLLQCLPNLTFRPIVKDGEILQLDIYENQTPILTIKDSIKILPSSLSKLAKDWKVQTLKEHFPHYFWNDSIESTLNYVGKIPPYECFEPKRTSKKDYIEMLELFKNKPWSFLEVSQTYIMSDCKALYQVLLKYFETLTGKFPIDPFLAISAPSVAFKIWRTEPKGWRGVNYADFSNTRWDTYLRESYLGGIVDVYKFHLQERGYYYDVNSLYPTAMCQPMPSGKPKIVDTQLWGKSFFGFIDVTVQTPDLEYIGLLFIKWQGRLVGPKGKFRGLFFSEELKFALENGYTIIKIHSLIQFEKANAFRDLILELNEMKVQAQHNNQPTIRNLAKLLMNSMYGRFGMKTSLTQTALLNNEEYIQYNKIFSILSEIQFNDFKLINYIQDLTKLGDSYTEKILKQYLIALAQRTNVAIASAVTAYSRMIINKLKLTALNLGAELFYSDTDSLVINKPFPPEYLDSAALGKFKLEYTIKEGIFALPKVYYLKTEEEQEVYKAKGYSGQLTREQYLSLINEKSITNLTMNKWFRSLKNSTIQIKKNQPYEIRYLFNKRRRTGFNSTTPLTFTT